MAQSPLVPLTPCSFSQTPTPGLPKDSPQTRDCRNSPLDAATNLGIPRSSRCPEVMELQTGSTRGRYLHVNAHHCARFNARFNVQGLANSSENTDWETLEHMEPRMQSSPPQKLRQLAFGWTDPPGSRPCGLPLGTQLISRRVNSSFPVIVVSIVRSADVPTVGFPRVDNILRHLRES